MNIHRQILRIALPAIFSNITVPLLTLCDTTITGHLGSELYMAAIAVGGMMINVAMWGFGFLRSGTSGLTAQALGSHDTDGCNTLFTRSLLLALSLGLLLVLLQLPMQWLLLRLISAPPQVSDLAGTYFRIMIWGAPPLLGTMAISGWFLGMQTSFYPMCISVTTNVVNIVASVLLVFVCRLGFIGTALGTLIANWLGLALALILAYYFNGRHLPFTSVKKGLSLRGSGRFFRVSSDIFLRSLCIMAVSLGMTSYAAAISAQALAVNAVMMQFFMFFSYFMDGFAFSAEALIGKSVGACDLPFMSSIKRALSLWSIGMVVIFTLIYGTLWLPICRFITPELSVLSGISELHLWLVVIPIVSVASFVYDGIYIGLTATRLMLASTLIGTILFFSINIFISPTSLSLSSQSGLWCAFVLYLSVRSLFLALMCPYASKRAMRLQMCR